MSESVTMLAMFEEIDPVSEGIDKLYELGLGDDVV